MKVFKFGGASIKDASGFKNVLKIIQNNSDEPLIVVVSALGKSTNALEEIHNHYFQSEREDALSKYNLFIDSHLQIVTELFTNDESILTEIKLIADTFFYNYKSAFTGKYSKDYDQLIPLGELLSSTILHLYLNKNGSEFFHLDATKCIQTDNTFRYARVEWEQTSQLLNSAVSKNKNYVVQGFVGFCSSKGREFITTLGREGSDFTAALIAYCLNANEVIIWKDVEGVMNADPRKFADAKIISKLSYKEAIEMTYFGASVIHPKTIKPLENKGIKLRVKSFLNPEKPGTIISNFENYIEYPPVFIVADNQILISFSTKDYSFVAEDHISLIFSKLFETGLRVRLMQNSALSFSICLDNDKYKIEKLIQELQKTFTVKYNDNLELLTVRHFEKANVNDLILGKIVLVEQKSRETLHLVLK